MRVWLQDEALKTLSAELTLIREALQSISRCLVSLTAIPEHNLPDKPAGAKAIGSYAITAMSEEDQEDLRAILQEKGFSEPQIEAMLVQYLAQDEEEEQGKDTK